jgi:hypothetical protein
VSVDLSVRVGGLELRGPVNARGGQAPPAVPPPSLPALIKFGGGGGPAEPGHADEAE